MLNASDGQSCDSKIELDTLALSEKLRDALVPFQTVVLHSSVHGEAHSAVHQSDTLCSTFHCCHFGSGAIEHFPSQGLRCQSLFSVPSIPRVCSRRWSDNPGFPSKPCQCYLLPVQIFRPGPINCCSPIDTRECYEHATFVVPRCTVPKHHLAGPDESGESIHRLGRPNQASRQDECGSNSLFHYSYRQFPVCENSDR